MRKRFMALLAPVAMVFAGFAAASPASAVLPACNSGTRLVHSGANVLIHDCTFTGLASSSNGAAVSNSGTLTLTNVTLSGNTTTGGKGGAIYNSGTLVLNNVTVSNNTSSSDGGGLYNTSSGTVTVNGATFNGNSAVRDGGGAWTEGTFTVNTATFGGPSGADANTAGRGGAGIYNAGDLTGSGLTLRGNIAGGGGGGLWNDAFVDLDTGTITGNSAKKGGGVHSSSESVESDSTQAATFKHFTVTDNHTSLDGGGFLFTGIGVNLIQDSVVGGNTSGCDGGGIFVGQFFDDCSVASAARARFGTHAAPHQTIQDFAQVTILRSTVKNNDAALAGGGIVGLGAMLVMADDTVSGNHAADAGGIGLLESFLLGPDPATLTSSSRFAKARTAHSLGGTRMSPRVQLVVLGLAENVTISGNHADSAGGGIDAPLAIMGIEHFTIADNTAGAKNAGVETGETDIFVGRTLVAHNTPANCNLGIAATEGPGTTDSANIESGTSCGFTQTSDLQGVDPKLGPLADNFGPAKTQALLLGSQAIDRVPNDSTCPAPSADERGLSRPQHVNCDTGAYECIGTAPTVTQVQPASGPPTGGTQVTITGTNFDRPATVTFGGVAAQDMVVNSSTEIVAKTPPGVGVVGLTITTCRANSPTSQVAAFTFLAPPGLPKAGSGNSEPGGVSLAWLAIAVMVASPAIGLALLGRRRRA